MKKTSRKRTGLKIVFSIVALALVVWTGSTLIAQIALRNYINTFDSVNYSKQIVPEVESEGYVSFRTDGVFRIMQINDIHLSGGMPTLKTDKKAIYEVMTMVQEEKPDLVILNGDSVFAVPSIAFNGGGTFNNKMLSKDIILMMERLGVYWSITFGNHDTEAFNYTNREKLGKLYMDKNLKYCIFNCDYSGYGVTNQCILVKTASGKIRKAVMLLDSNDYVDKSLAATINWRYDTIHDDQVQWAKDVLLGLSSSDDSLKSLFFFHIPVGEFATAYRDLESNGFSNTKDTKYIGGYWNELMDEEMGERVWYGGCCQTDKEPKDVDNFFEVLGPDGIDSLEGVFCAHDHVNNAVVEYKGVLLSYGQSIDNNAYSDIARYGRQRGAVVVSIAPSGNVSQEHKNAYLDYHVKSDMFIDVDSSSYYYDDVQPGKGIIK